MLNGKQFEVILSARRFEPPSVNFADRIIAAAKDKEVLQEKGIIAYLAGIIESVVPHPAYAMAFVLIIGILIGLTTPVTHNEEQLAINSEEEGTL